MNKKNRILALLLAFVLVLAACSKANETTETTAENTESSEGSLSGEITVQAEETWEEHYQAAADKIMAENPDAKITLKIVPAFEHIDTITATDASNPDVADVFALPSDRFTELYQNNVLGPLNAEAIAEKATGFDLENSMAQLFKLEDGFFAFPYNIETLVSYVNTNNAEAAGIDVENTTFEITDPTSPEEILIPIPDAWYGVALNNSVDMNLLTKAEDGTLSSDYTTPYEELEPAKKEVFDAIYDYWKMNDEAGTTLVAAADDRNAYVTEKFADGAGGVVRLDGPWAAEGLRDAIEAGGIAIYPINKIQIAGNDLVHWQGGWALGINARIEGDAEKQALAEAMIAEIVNPENAESLFVQTGKILENASAEVYENSELSDFDKQLIKTTIDSYNNSIGRPLFSEYGQVWSTWENAILSWNNSKPADAAAAYAEVKASFDAMMESFQ